MTRFPNVDYEDGPFGAVYCTSSGLMGPQQGGDHIKGCEFRIARRFDAAPAVSASVTTIGAGNALVLYAVKVNDNVDGATQVVVYAQTWDAKPAKGVHVCSIVVTGTPVSK